MDTLINRLNRAEVLELKNQIDYQEGGISSLSLVHSDYVNITLMAVDEGQGLSTHAAGGDALATILEGEVEITVGGVPHILHAGESILMPVRVPHSLKAITRFKFYLTVVFPSISK